MKFQIPSTHRSGGIPLTLEERIKERDKSQIILNYLNSKRVLNFGFGVLDFQPEADPPLAEFGNWKLDIGNYH